MKFFEKLFGFKPEDKISSPIEKQEEALPFIVSEYGQLRYQIEHCILRNEFFNNPANVIAAIIQSDLIYSLYDQTLKNNHIENPHKKEEFLVDAVKFGEGNILVCIELPIPKYTPLCYRIYLVCDSSYSNTAYYTVERGEEGGFLCRWDGENHINLHSLKNPEWKENKGLMKTIEIKIVVDLYNKRNS